MTDNRTRQPETEGEYTSAASESTRRKGGKIGNGSEEPPPGSEGFIPIPKDYLEQMRRVSAESFKILLYMMACAWESGRPAHVMRVREIAEATGLSVEMTTVQLRGLSQNDAVVETRNGWRLKLDNEPTPRPDGGT